MAINSCGNSVPVISSEYKREWANEKGAEKNESIPIHSAMI